MNKLQINFNSPYKATNIRDFWNRWHITLSRFLRDYIYIPIGGNKVRTFRLYGNLFATFLIGGFWHGAGWTFIFWGFLHALAIIIHRIWSNFGIKLNKLLSWFITFNFLNFSWIFFRASDWNDALKIIKGMIGLSGVVLPNFLQNFSLFRLETILFGNIYVNFGDDDEIFFWILFAFCLVLIFKNSNQIISNFKLNNKIVVSIVFLIVISLMNLGKNVDFIYYNF